MCDPSGPLYCHHFNYRSLVNNTYFPSQVSGTLFREISLNSRKFLRFRLRRKKDVHLTTPEKSDELK